MKSELEKIKKESHKAIEHVANLEALEKLRVQFLGRKGELAQMRAGLKEMSEGQKKSYGKSFNSVKDAIEKAIDYKTREFERKKWDHIKDSEWVDVTEPVLSGAQQGHKHPNTLVQETMEEIAQLMGFVVIDGPELESDYYNFEALNIPPSHPARDMQDTFYIDGKHDWVMRSHPSNMQVRLMRQYGAPVRVAYAGKNFRNEATDASHEHTFFQYEALIVDKHISMGHLKGIIKHTLQRLFNKEVTVRLRPSYFPFTEPSVELDMACLVCAAKGCAVCKYSGWIEMMGAGLIHPNVMRAADLDPAKWQGVAYAFGLTRLVMMRYGIEDIRHLMSGDLRFLKQF